MLYPLSYRRRQGSLPAGKGPTVAELLTNRTVLEYERYVEKWERAGRPEPEGWLAGFTPHVHRNARAALMWQARREGRALNLVQAPRVAKVPEAFTELEMAKVRQLALGQHARLPWACDVLYATGARISEACAIEPDDVTETHIVLRETKRRPGGLRVERAIPLGPVARQAVLQLRAMHAPRTSLLGWTPHGLQQQLRRLDACVPFRVHAHKFRATFATTMLSRGVDVRTVQELMGHTDLATTMRYLAVTDERKAAAVSVL
jgi:site-specific recombinase XerD